MIKKIPQGISGVQRGSANGDDEDNYPKRSVEESQHKITGGHGEKQEGGHGESVQDNKEKLPVMELVVNFPYYNSSK